ncbi:hypothetical protein [Tolypothrix sp. VBCCA 56010]|uniref:hypothetical protein n=1 Tax=Tolypothrix sp. VBCCA 56010 TaxID=3137731 RepID=UPI003D7E948A
MTSTKKSCNHGACIVSRSLSVSFSQALLASASAQLRHMASICGNLLQLTCCGYFRDTALRRNKRVLNSGCPAIEKY